MARRYFGDANPLGQHFQMGDQSAPKYEIVGVVKDVKHLSLREPARPTLYLPFFQEPGDRGLTFALRTAARSGAMTVAIRGVVREIDPTAQVRDLRTMNDLVNWAVRQERVLGRPVEDPSRTPSAVIHHKRHNYFAVLGLRLLRGRDFTELDQESAPGVAILNETLVRNYFPDEGPLGKAIKLLVDDREKWFSIVGAIADVKNVSCMREAAEGAVCSILWRSVLLFYIASRFLTETRANW